MIEDTDGEAIILTTYRRPTMLKKLKECTPLSTRPQPVFKHLFRRTIHQREDSTNSDRSSEVGDSQGEL